MNYRGTVPPAIDPLTSAAKNISTDHNYIHEGILYGSEIFTTIAAAATYKILLITPGELYMHYRNFLMETSSNKIRAQFCSNPTVSDLGTAVTINNHNQVYGDAATMLLYKGVTTSDDGTELPIGNAYVGGGSGVGGRTAGSSTDAKNEIVLEQDTGYLIKITNGGSADCDVQLKPIWYEEQGYAPGV